MERLTIDPKKFKLAYQKDVSQFVEKKLGLRYLSWGYVTLFLRTEFPELSVEYEKTPDGSYLFGDKQTGFYVLAFITDGEKSTPSLFFPVMDPRNEAVKTPDVMDVNKSLMRAAVKVVAMTTGLGLRLYTGEDLPAESRVRVKPEPERGEPERGEPGETVDSISQPQLRLISTLRAELYSDESEYREVLKKNFNVDSAKQLTKKQASKFLEALNKKKQSLSGEGDPTEVEEGVYRNGE